MNSYKLTDEINTRFLYVKILSYCYYYCKMHPFLDLSMTF